MVALLLLLRTAGGAASFAQGGGEEDEKLGQRRAGPESSSFAETDSDSSGSVRDSSEEEDAVLLLPEPVDEDGVYALDSLHHLQRILLWQQQQQNGDPYIFWFAYLHDDSSSCAWADELRSRVQQVAALLQQENQHQREAAEEPITTPVMVRVASVALSPADRQRLQQQFGFTTLPALVLVSSTSVSSSPYMVEYTGPLHTADELYRGVTHYFDRLSLTAQPVTGGGAGSSNRQQQQQQQHPLWEVQPRHFAGWDEMDAFLRRHARRLLFNSSSFNSKPVLSRRRPPAERAYAHWLWDSSNGADNGGAVHRVMVQCRQQPQPPDNDDENKSQISKPPSYQEFDTFARTLASRRDCLFLVLSNQECTDERVDVWEIPADFDWEKEPFWTTPLPLRHYYFDSSPSTDNQNRNEHPEKSSRLVEFLIQVCTDTILWFDRQTTAPIAFAEHRRVHAVLFVDMHNQVMELVESVVADAAERSKQQQEEQAAQPNDDDAAEAPRLSMDDFSWLRKQRAAVDQFRRACREHWLRTVADSGNDDDETSSTNTILLDRDMVCLVVPSTEIRILTTWGIDVWSPLDAEFMMTVGFGDDVDHDGRSSSTTKEKQTLPALLITDQRYGGTRRYYYNQTEEAESNKVVVDDYSSFITSFWEGQLQYDIKSSSARSRHAHTNEAGVRILTANSLDTELLSSLAPPPPRGDLSVSDNVGQQQQQQHALILFTAPTCGHCKRFLVIWNHLARLLQHIGWSSFLTLYQMDVTENDVASTLNLTIQWLPDLYYSNGGDDGTAAAPPQQPHEHHHPHRVFIRYNRTDAVGDGVGAVRDSTELLEWLVHLDAFADAKRAAELLSHLNELPLPPDATAATQKG